LVFFKITNIAASWGPTQLEEQRRVVKVAWETPLGDVSQLKQRLIDSRSSLSQVVIDDAIDQ